MEKNDNQVEKSKGRTVPGLEICDMEGRTSVRYASRHHLHVNVADVVGSRSSTRSASSTHEEITPLNRETLARVPSRATNLEIYVNCGERHERVAIGWEARHANTPTKLEDWEAWWNSLGHNAAYEKL